MEITAIVSGERDFAARLDQMPARVRERLVTVITSLTARLLAAVQQNEPQRTGALRSETQMRVDVTDDVVRGRVFVAAPSAREHAKAAALEYGAHGMVAVRAYQRQGHTPFGMAAAQVVAAYRRQANIVADRFERTALDAMRGTIKAEITEALESL